MAGFSLALGLVLGGATGGALAWLLGLPLRLLPTEWRYWAVVMAGVVAIGHEIGVVRFELPQRRRQISQDMLLHRGRVEGPLVFGFQLGTGLATFLPTGLPHLVAWSALLLIESPWLAMGVGAVFGIGRALVPLERLSLGSSGIREVGLSEISRHPFRKSALITSTFGLALVLAGNWLGNTQA